MGGGNYWQYTKIFRPFSFHWVRILALHRGEMGLRDKRIVFQSLPTPRFVGIRLALALQKSWNMLSELKRRFHMSPLLLMMLLALVPFPILAIALVADRWRKPPSKAVS
jgi:hypothetical protein